MALALAQSSGESDAKPESSATPTVSTLMEEQPVDEKKEEGAAAAGEGRGLIHYIARVLYNSLFTMCPCIRLARNVDSVHFRQRQLC